MGSLLPVQRELGARARTARQGSNDAWWCSQAVLIAEVDEKCRAESLPLRRVDGLAGRATGRRARRSKPARDGEVTGTVADPPTIPRKRRRGYSATEGVLVPSRSSPLTGRRRRRDLAVANVERAGRPVSRRGGRDRGRQKRSCMLGPPWTTPWAGGTARRSHRSWLHQDRAVLDEASLGASARGARPSGCREAEAGGSPSSEAPPDVGRRRSGKARAQPARAGRRAQAGGSAGREARRDEGARGRESDGRSGARIGSRLQKSERRIFLEIGAARPGREATVDRWLGEDGQPLTRRDRAEASERVRGEAAQVIRERLLAYPGRKIRDEPTEGVLAHA